MAEKWVKIYDLAQDAKRVADVQNATLNTDEYGLVSEIALFGSDEWWKAIEDGGIPTHEVVGTISRVYMSGHNDWPEFEIDSGGKKTRWTRFGADKFYVVGRSVRVEYVTEKAKKAWTGSPYQSEVIGVYIQDSK